MQLVPGANEGGLSTSANGTRPDERRQTVAVSVNGAGDIENNHLIDGLDNNERLQGTAGVRVSVDAEGRVTAVEPVGAPRGLGFDEAARRAALSAVYRPGTRDGVPVAMQTMLEIRFVVDRGTRR